MIEIHHLKESRSRRITWLLEELELDYQVVMYQRDAQTRLAPPELKLIHPLGKAPILRDGETTVFESGAIVQYLIQRYGNGRMAPAENAADYPRYLSLMHYAEGSAMLPLMLRLYVGRLKEAGEPLHPRIESELDTHFGFLNDALVGRTFFMGHELTGADVQLSFPIQMFVAAKGPEKFPELTRFVKAIEARPAYERAISKAGQ